MLESILSSPAAVAGAFTLTLAGVGMGILGVIDYWAALAEANGEPPSAPPAPPPAPTPRPVCAWCQPGEQGPGITHGICGRHSAEQLAAFREHQSEGGA